MFEELYNTFSNILSIKTDILPVLNNIDNNNNLQDLALSLPTLLTIATIIIFFVLLIILIKNLILIWFK